MTQYKLKKTKTEESILNAYKRMEERIVASYFAIENSVVGIDVRHFSVGLGYELQHAFKGVIENKASMHNVHLRVGYTF